MKNMEKCRAYVDKLRNEYIIKHITEGERDELIGENNIEKRDIQGYHGREILELLQNADDAYQKSIDIGQKPDCELTVEIDYHNSLLSVSNTGTFFDKNGIKAIVQGNNSPKIGYIGNKGTGFRSILNWANKVRIFSGDYAVEFSEEYAKKILESIKEKPQISKQLERRPNLYIPMLQVPYNIDRCNSSEKTTIEIEIDYGKQNDDFSVQKQLENIDLRTLLFLPNISQIHISTDDIDIIYKRSVSTINHTKEISLTKSISNEIVAEESYYVFDKTIKDAIKEDDIMKSILLSIAVPKDFSSFRSTNLYSFFPLLDTNSPFNCILHASYLLDDHRNTINSGEENKIIIKEQLAFLIEVAKRFVKNNRFDIAYNILCPVNISSPNWCFLAPFSKFGLEDHYFDSLSKEKILLTVNKERICVEDNPKIIKGRYPNAFIGEHFNSLLKPLDDENITLLLELLSKRRNQSTMYEEGHLLSAINATSERWTIKQQVEVFIWWNSYWKSPYSGFTARTLPNLLKSQDNKWLRYSGEYYFLVGDFESFFLPQWVKVPAVRSDYQQQLFTAMESSKEVLQIREKDKVTPIPRIICQNKIFPSVSFTYSDRRNIIKAINVSVNTYKKAVDFVKWLWKNYRSESDNWTPPIDVTYRFPNEKDKSCIESDKCYWGSNYGNPLAEKLFGNDYSAFPKASIFSVKDSEIEAFMLFIKKFGVREFPQIEEQKVDPILSYKEKCKDVILHHGDVGASSSVYCQEFILPYIQNLEQLLTQLSTTEIIEWIIKDQQLSKNLSSKTAYKVKIQYKGSTQYYSRTFTNPYYFTNYVRTLFNESKWLTIEGERYAPSHVLHCFKSKDNQKFASLTPVLTIEILDSYARDLKVDVDKIIEVFQDNRFDLCDRIIDLDSESFYSIMLKVPKMEELSQSIDISRRINRIIEYTSDTKRFDTSDSKTKFMAEGEILVKYKGKIQFFPAKDSYLPSTKIINKKNVPIVEKGQRTNNENFVSLFGCKEYTAEYTIIKDSITTSLANQSFQDYFEVFRKYANAYSEKNANIGKHGNNLTIHLVSKISILRNDKIETIDEEYTLLRDKTTNWYITIFGSSYDINTISEVIENIYANIANTSGFEEGKIGELFRAKSKSDREFLINKEFGCLSVIDDNYYENDIKARFIETLKKISPEYPIETIDIDFDDFKKQSNLLKIITLFKEIKTDINEFKSHGFIYSINLIPLYQKELQAFIQRENKKFKNVLYARAMNKKDLQDTFIKTIDDFISFDKIIDYQNSVYFIVLDKVYKKFGRWDDVEINESADDAYKNNYDKLNPNGLFGDEISENIKVQTMIYFNRKDEFVEWLEIQKRKRDEKKEVATDIYSQYRNAVPNETKIEYHEQNDISNHSGGFNHKHNNGAITNTKLEQQQRNQKTLGNKGELLIYNLLCKKVGKNNVHPRSEAFVELKILAPGQAISGSYDLSYHDENGDEFFVEVKSGENNSFIITLGELDFAKKNPDNYKLFIVYNLEKMPPDYIELPLKFWEDERFKSRSIIEKIEFRF